MGKLFANPEAMKKVKGLEGDSRKEVQKIVDSVDGIDRPPHSPTPVPVLTVI